MRRKSLLTYFIFCSIPLLLLAGLNYWNAQRTVDSTVSAIVQNDLNSLSVSVDELLNDNKKRILQLAIAPAANRLVARREVEVTNILPESPYSILNSLPDVSDSFQNLTLFDDTRKPLWTYTGNTGWSYCRGWGTPAGPQPDASVWTQQGNVALEQVDGPPPTLRFSVPIHDNQGTNIIGAVAGEVDLDSVFANASRAFQTRSFEQSVVLVLDRSGNVVYSSDRSLKDLSVNAVLPSFKTIATAMTNNQSGLGEFRPTAGSSHLAAYAPLPRLNVAVAVARNRAEFLSAARRWGVVGFLLALLGALGAAFILERHVHRRSQGIERVAAEMSAIAKGEVDRRIILKSSDDARGLADNINVVTEQLRAKIAREEETRQFESFIRISAMLTHDLKNAIEGLSLTVGNMERHFDNPQFRADALKGLTSATDKLKALVARLSRPLTSLSGEHKRPTNIDLIPVINRVLARTAEPMRGKHAIVTRLPQSLPALGDAARVEEVIENLVLNAFEAMADKGGTLTIEAGQTDAGAPTFSVGDTGRGMSQIFIETRLFRPFATTKRSGIGLGLYTCREVILASGGSIEVDSVEGAGTTFRVVLPSIPPR